jgi:comEA protein
MFQLDVRRNAMLWFLGLMLVIGLGFEVPRLLGHRAVEFPGIVVQDDAEAQALHRMADSIMQARAIAADAPLNINTASAAEFETLDGIGPVLAQRIVAYREMHGRFMTVDELDSVSGIGVKRLASIRERCTVQ